MNEDLLSRLAAEIGITFPPGSLIIFGKFMQLVLDYNKTQNLTRITDEREFIVTHFIDSLLGVNLISPHAAVADIGSGAGIPGIPLAIILPHAKVYLIESERRKAAFLELVISRLKLGNVTVINMRAEEVGRDKRYREKMDAAVSRAAAQLSVLLELGFPLIKTGGKLLGYKGPEAEKELTAGRGVSYLLGGDGGVLHKFQLPENSGSRIIIEITKHYPIAQKYPRRPGIPQKHPLKGNTGRLSNK